jgi:peptidyl-prolyl cis-trans isomerase C
MEMLRRQTALIMMSCLLAGASSALVCFAQSSPAPKPAGTSTAQSAASSPDKVVLKVGNTSVTKADVDYLIGGLNPRVQEAVAARGRKPVGDEYAMMVLLSQKAQTDHLDASPDFQRRIALEKLQLLAQEEYHKMSEDLQISPDEINTYYNAHKNDYEDAQVREFVVRKKAADAKPGAPGLSDVEAKARLASIQKAIEAGTDIKEVAKKFEVPNVVMINADPQTVHRGEMIPALDKVAFDLKPNQFSPPVETSQAVVLLQLLTHQQQEVKAVSGQIEKELRQQKLSAAMDDMKAKATIWMDPEYFKEPETAPASDSDAAGKSGVAPKTPAQH